MKDTLCPNCVHCALCQKKTLTSDMQILNSGLIPENLTIDESLTLGEKIFVSCDIGTTTLALAAFIIKENTPHIVAKTSMVNPQIRYGLDVVSRLSLDFKSEAFSLMRECLLEALIKCFCSLQKDLKLKGFTSEFHSICIVGNTTMLYILFNEDTTPLARYPFAITQNFGAFYSYKEVFSFAKSTCDISPQTPIYVPKVMSAFLGADTVASCSATVFFCDKALMLDIGTNCEVALFDSTSSTLVATSSPSGPAFEGYGISCGVRAIAGAIYATNLEENGKWNYRTIGDIEPVGLCGSGILSAISEGLSNGLILRTGLIAGGKSSVKIACNLALTQGDIRNFQLAKSAIKTALDMLLKDNIVTKLYLSGGFGTLLNVADLFNTNTLQKNVFSTIIQAGNTALTGGLCLLLSSSLRQKSEEIAMKAHCINMAEEDDFQDIYIASLSL